MLFQGAKRSFGCKISVRLVVYFRVPHAILNPIMNSGWVRLDYLLVSYSGSGYIAINPNTKVGIGLWVLQC